MQTGRGFTRLHPAVCTAWMCCPTEPCDIRGPLTAAQMPLSSQHSAAVLESPTEEPRGESPGGADSLALDGSRASSSEPQSPPLKEMPLTPPPHCCHKISRSETRQEPWGPGCQHRKQETPAWGPEGPDDVPQPGMLAILGAGCGGGQPPLACQLHAASGEGSLPVTGVSQHRALKVCWQRASLELKAGTPH